MKTRVKGRFVIGYDGQDHVIYENAEVVFEGDTITYVGFKYPGPVDTTIDVGNSIVSPGFIDLNALGDIDHSVLQFEIPSGVGPGLNWSKEYALAGPRDVLTPDEEEFKSRYALIQLITNGITTALPVTSLRFTSWAETFKQHERVVDAAVDLGIRTYLGPSYRSAVRVANSEGTRELMWNEERGEEGLRTAVQFIRKYDGAHGGLIRGLLVPSTIETCTPAVLRKTKEYSDELACPIRLHAAQSMGEFRLIQAQFHRTPIEHLSGLSFLGPRTLIAHAVYTSGNRRAEIPAGQDLELLRDSQTCVIHCPLVTGRDGVILESFARYRKMGIRVAMGTDTYPADMILAMGLGSAMCKQVDQDDRATSVADWYRAATLSGAEALGRPDLGKLAAGAKADIVALGLDDFRVAQIDDPIRTLFLNMTGANVQTVIVNGRVVMKDRQIPGMSLAEMHLKSQTVFQKMKASYSQRDYLRRPSEDLFPSSFRVMKGSTES